jgi:hypothetical protein
VAGGGKRASATQKSALIVRRGPQRTRTEDRGIEKEDTEKEEKWKIKSNSLTKKDNEE